jgi:hypothetical protein
MRTPWLLGTLLIGLALAAPAVSADASLARLIAQLGSDRYEEREVATRDLDALGSAALEALRRATTDDDAEVRRRARGLIATIEKRLEAARLLAPRKVHLVYKDTPVAEAVADLARKTGYAIQLQAATGAVQGRKITLDTGEVPFWQAFEQFCRAAGLSEPHLAASTRNSTHSLDDAQRAALQAELRLRSARRAASLQEAQPANRLVLHDGQPQSLPTCQSGAIRFRAVPVAGETGFNLDVTPEPGMAWRGIVALRIDKAIDEHGQELKAAPASSASAVAAHEDPAVAFMLAQMMDEEPPTTQPRQTPVRFDQGAKPAKLLREVHGTMAVRVQTPVEPLLTVDNILKATGQTATNAQGGSLKVIDVARLDDNQIRVRAEVATRDAAGPLAVRRRFIRGNAGAVMIVNGRVIRSSAPESANTNLALLDGKGQSIPLTGNLTTRTEVNGDGVFRQEFLLTFRANTDQGEPARLVLNGRRTVSIEVPFTLKDVPLR